MLKPSNKADYTMSDLNVQGGREARKRGENATFSEFMPLIQASLQTHKPVAEAPHPSVNHEKHAGPRHITAQSGHHSAKAVAALRSESQIPVADAEKTVSTDSAQTVQTASVPPSDETAAAAKSVNPKPEASAALSPDAKAVPSDTVSPAAPAEARTGIPAQRTPSQTEPAVNTAATPDNRQDAIRSEVKKNTVIDTSSPSLNADTKADAAAENKPLPSSVKTVSAASPSLNPGASETDASDAGSDGSIMKKATMKTSVQAENMPPVSSDAKAAGLVEKSPEAAAADTEKLTAAGKAGQQPVPEYPGIADSKDIKTPSSLRTKLSGIADGSVKTAANVAGRLQGQPFTTPAGADRDVIPAPRTRGERLNALTSRVRATDTVISAPPSGTRPDAPRSLHKLTAANEDKSVAGKIRTIIRDFSRSAPPKPEMKIFSDSPAPKITIPAVSAPRIQEIKLPTPEIKNPENPKPAEELKPAQPVSKTGTPITGKPETPLSVSKPESAQAKAAGAREMVTQNLKNPRPESDPMPDRREDSNSKSEALSHSTADQARHHSLQAKGDAGTNPDKNRPDLTQQHRPEPFAGSADSRDRAADKANADSGKPAAAARSDISSNTQQDTGTKSTATRPDAAGFSLRQGFSDADNSGGRRNSGDLNSNQTLTGGIPEARSTETVGRSFATFVNQAGQAPKSELVGKILQVIQQNYTDSTKTVFKLDGGSAGKMDVSFHKHEDNVRILIQVGDEATRNLVNRLLPEIRDNLGRQGLDFTSIETSLREEGDSHSDRKEETNQNGLPKLTRAEVEELLDFSDIRRDKNGRDFGYNTLEITV